MSLILWGWAVAAQAQMPPAITLGAPKGEARWVTADTETQRFPDDSGVPGPKLRAGDAVELVMIDGARARVHKGELYGWLPAALLTTEAPASAVVPAGGGLLGAPPQLGGGAPLLPPLAPPGPAPKK